MTHTLTEKMTPEQARSFDSYSVANALTVKVLLTCGCEPYQDVFTYRRWLAQGFQVQRGQYAIKIPVLRHVTREVDGENGKETKDIRILGSGAVFCRHQVKPINGKEQDNETSTLV